MYLSTSLASDKVREVRANPAVALYYCDAENFHGVMLSGRAEVLDDPELKLALWSPDWSIYWPGGASDPDYVILRIAASDVSGWWSGARSVLRAHERGAARRISDRQGASGRRAHLRPHAARARGGDFIPATGASFTCCGRKGRCRSTNWRGAFRWANPP